MKRELDKRTGRPLSKGRDLIEALSQDELEAELTIAAIEPTRRALRLEAVQLELVRRRRRALQLV
jgi:hypothetical protein